MKLLVVSGDPSVAEGRNSKFRSVLEELRQGWERVDVVTPPVNGTGTAPPLDNVHFHPAPLPGRWAQYRFVSETVRELAAAHRHDLVTVHVYGLCVAAAATRAALRGAPHRPRLMDEVHHVPGVPRSAGARDQVERAVLTAYMRRSWRGADRVRVVNSREAPSYLADVCGVGADRIVAVPSVFIEPEFRPYPEEAKRFDLMFCGRVTENKGLDLLLDTLREVRRSRPGATLLVKASGGNRSGWLRRRADQLGLSSAVTFVDWVDSVEALGRLYAAARVLVCTSYNEGGPRVTVEAMACGTPVVSTRVGVMPDLIEQGRNGFLAGWNAGEIASRCLELLGDPEAGRRMGEAARGSVSGMTREAVIGRYRDTCMAVAGGR